jgi:hypothetical protein
LAGALVKDRDRHGRDVDRKIQAKSADQKQHEQDDLGVGLPRHIARAIDEAAADGTASRRGRAIDAHHAACAEHRDEGQRVELKHPAGADAGNLEASDRGPDHASGVERGRVEPDGVRQIAFADALGDKSLPRRRVERCWWGGCYSAILGNRVYQLAGQLVPAAIPG